MKTKSIKIDISLTDNRTTKHASFSGYAFLDSGFLHGEISHIDGLSNSESVLLTAFTLTGCPIAARAKDHVLNPWINTKGRYQGRRVLSSEAFSAESRISSVPNGDEIVMKLEVNVEGELPAITGVYEPFQERIAQRQIGELYGQFQVQFTAEKGELVSATAETDYSLPIDFSVEPVWRNITISGVGAAQRFSQFEQIDLFDQQFEADADLAAKIPVARGR